MELIYAYQEWPYRETFRISRGDSICSELFVAWIRDGDHIGRGECSILTQYGHTRGHLAGEFEAVHGLLRQGLTRQDVATAIPNSSVRNAIDCALWDLECKRTARDIWDLTGIARPGSIAVDLTISVNPTGKMVADASRAVGEGYRILKLKADTQDVVERVAAITEAVHGVALIVDANEAWDIQTLRDLSEPLARMGVILIEQPLPHAADEDLIGHCGSIPICADESCRDLDDLDRLAERYQAINIKLDKAGGLTPALALARGAKARGLAVMLGCSGPTSLGAAPAYVVAALADYVDLDGPALLLEDREGAMTYRDGRLYDFDPGLWGG